MMVNLKTYRKTTPRLADLIPWAALVCPDVILNKDGSLQSTLTFRGPDVESSTESQLIATMAKFNNMLKRLGSGWVVYVESQRRPCNRYFPPGHFPDAVSALIDAERRQQFADNCNNFINHYYFTVQWLAPSEKSSKLSQLFIKAAPETTRDKQALDYFIRFRDQLFDLLTDASWTAQLLQDDELLTYLHSTVSANPHPIRVPETPMYLDALLADTPLLGGLAAKLGDAYLRVVSLLSFPATSLPALLEQLNHLPFSYRWVSRFIVLDKMDAENQLKAQRRRWFAKRKGLLNLLQETFTRQESRLVNTHAVDNANDVDQALQALSNDQVAYGYYSVAIVVTDSDAKLADEKQQQIQQLINRLGFTTVAEKINRVEAWLSSLPGQAYANVRRPLIHTLNLAHLLPLSAVWAGEEENRHLNAPPLMQLHTPNRTPFRLAHHIGDVGHQMIIGPTGAGKSVLLNFIALQFLRYQQAQVFIFDNGGSFLASTHGVNGAYYPLGTQPNSPAFQPLTTIDNETDRQWAAEWLQLLLSHEQVTVTPAIKQALWQALTALAQAPRSQRTLTGLCALLQNQLLRQAFSHYTISGPFGQLLDASHESARQQRWQYYELSQLMGLSDATAAVLHYLFHCLEKQFDGSPTLIILDEAWSFLDHPLFAAQIRDWLKSLRKKNVSVLFATQSIGDILNASIAPSLLESCPSRIFLPNDRALEPQIHASYEKLGLNEKQIQLIAQASAKQQYYYQSTLGNRLFDLRLSPIALAFCAASTPKQKQAIHSLLIQRMEEPFAKCWLDYCGLDWAWKLIAELNEEKDFAYAV